MYTFKNIIKFIQRGDVSANMHLGQLCVNYASYVSIIYIVMARP